MASLATLNQTVIDTTDKGIVEPLGAPQTVASRLDEFFPDHIYSHSRNGLLSKLLTTLVGDAGANSLKKKMLYPRLTNSLFTTYFTDIDKFYGSVYGFNRIEEEIYTIDPFVELIDEDEWQEIRRKDSWYKSRCLEFMRALQLGTTPAGLALACQAASGVECSIVERWKYLDDQASDESTGVINVGATLSRQEFIVIPHTNELTPKQARRISNIMHRLKPINTIFTVAPQEKPRVEVEIRGVSATSQHFQAKRLVTGNKAVKYPPIDKKTGLWIEPGVEKEAPNFAFGQRSEFITWPTILGATASSAQVGPFNKLQRLLFPHLESIPDDLYQFDGKQAYSNVPVQLEITEPWVGRNTTNTLINNFFSLGYFADPNVPQLTEKKFFWASTENEPPTDEFLEIEFDALRAINYIEFEISTKPIRYEIQWYDEDISSWRDVDYIDNDLINNNREVVFTSSNNSWHQARLAFTNVKTRLLRITFTRQSTPFPYASSPSFAWSIEVRGLRAASIVTTIDDFIGEVDPLDNSRVLGDGGIDILGNSYRTVLEPDRYAPTTMIDGNLSTFWQSQTNPSRFAVENLYFDIRDNTGGPSTIDEIYIDPITAGCLMHIYWANDEPGTPPVEQQIEDWRLWNPIPRHFILTKGHHSLKQSITAKYIKLEFTKLIPQPYKALELPFKPVRYKTHPSWVQEYITKSLDIQTKDAPIDFSNQTQVTLDYINLGVINPNITKLDPEIPSNIEDYLAENIDGYHQNFETYRIWDKRLTNEDASVVKTEKEQGIEIHLNLFTEDLAQTLSSSGFINKFLANQGTDGLFSPEAPLVEKQLVSVSSRNDRTPADEEKNYPDMWFPRTARHAYKILEAQRDSDIGYNVAIREISFHRRDATFPVDSPFYVDTLIDDVNIESNTFVLADWRLVVSEEFLGEGTGGLGDENFDVLTPDREVFTI
jgi:hypothetical protein